MQCARELSSPVITLRTQSRVALLQIPYNIAVVDAGGGLVAHVRMDGAWLGSVDIAIDKAWTARAFDVATDELAQLTQSGRPGFGLNTTNHSSVVILAAGCQSPSTAP